MEYPSTSLCLNPPNPIPPQVSISVWFPSSLELLAEDPTLNKVLPSNVAAAPPGCSYERYQTSALRLTATWSNGGNSPGDVLTGADVTDLASFTSRNPARVQVVGASVRVRGASE